MSLMAEADSENGLHGLLAARRGLDDPADVVHCLDGHLGVSGAVAEEEAVVFGLVERVVPGDDVDAGAPLHQAADLVDLEAAVHGADAGKPGGVHGVGLLRNGSEKRSLYACTMKPTRQCSNSSV